MVLECPDGLFRAVASVHVWRHELILASVVGNGFEEGLAGFVVQDVYVRGCVLGRESVVEIIVCPNAMAVMLQLEGAHENSIGFTVEGYHYVLVASACLRREASRVIREYVIDWDNLDVNGWGGWLPGRCDAGGCVGWLGRAYVLPRLHHMSA